MRRRLPDGTIDPTDTGKKQPDGAINLHHVHHQTTLADIVTIHPTTASYMTTIYASVRCLATGEILLNFHIFILKINLAKSSSCSS